MKLVVRLPVYRCGDEIDGRTAIILGVGEQTIRYLFISAIASKFRLVWLLLLPISPLLSVFFANVSTTGRQDGLRVF